ncbi:porin [Trypoxylus dichotomus]
MPVPFYADIGKKPRDILNNGYHFGLIKLDAKAKPLNGITFNCGTTYTIEEKKLAACVSGKGAADNFGFGIKYSTNVLTQDSKLTGNLITGDVSVNDQFLKVTADCSADPTTQDITGGNIKNAFKDEHVAVNVDTFVKKGGPFIIEGAIALECEGLAGGYQLAYDANENKLSKNNVAAEYTINDATIAARIDNMETVGLGVGFKVNDQLNVAVDVSWTKEDNAVHGTLGGTFELPDVKGTARAKINHDIGLGLSYTQHVIDNVTVTASALIDCKHITNTDEAKHKIGLAVEIEI